MHSLSDLSLAGQEYLVLVVLVQPEKSIALCADLQ